MHFRSLLIPILMAAPAAAQTGQRPAGTPTKVAIIAFQQAVLTTQEGQQAAAALKSKFDPRKSQLEKKQADLQAMQAKLQGGGALTADARTKLQNDIAVRNRALTHDADDLNSEVQEEEGKIMQGMAQKMGDIIKDYATKNGYAVVLDVSSQTTPVIWAEQSVNITADIVKLYDQAHPAKGGAAASPAPAPPPAKKQ